MTQTAERLKAELAALPAGDRAEIAYYLLQTLDEETDPDAETAWDAELARRWEAIKSGKADWHPAEEVFARLREKYS